MLWFSIIFVGCKKDSIQAKVELPENISRIELKNWIANYQATITNGPKALLDQAVKTYYKGQMIVKVPLSSGGGDLFFTKSDQLEVQFIRRVNIDDNKNQFNGYDEFINMNNYRYLKINYSEGKEISRIGSNSTSKTNNQIKSNNEYEGSWLGAILYCIGKYIIAIPKRDENGWDCYGPGNDNPQEAQTFIIADAGGSQFNWAAWHLFYQPTYNNIIGPSDPWLPYYGGFYDPNNPPEYLPPPNVVNPNDPGLIELALFHKFSVNNNYQTLYPKFYSLVKNLYKTSLTDRKILDGLKSYGHFTSDEKLFEILQFGEGAEIEIKDINSLPYTGRFRYATLDPKTKKIYFEISKIREFEQGDADNARGFSLFLFVTLMHESVHYGNAINGFIEKIKEDWGYGWETYVYGRHIDSPSEAWDYILRKN